MGSKSPPPAPDYVGAASATGSSQREANREQTIANRPNVQTPWGQQTWNYTPGKQFDAEKYLAANPEVQAAIDAGQFTGALDHYNRHGRAEGREGFGTPDQWESRITLTPEQQAALDAQQRVQLGRSNAAEELLGRATASTRQPIPWDNLPGRADRVEYRGTNADPSVRNLYAYRPRSLEGDIRTGLEDDLLMGVNGGPIQRQVGSPNDWRQRAQEATWEFMRPGFDEARQEALTRLSNQGLTEGSEAWNREMRRLDDAEVRGRLQAYGEGRAEAGQLFGQDLQAGEFANRAQAQEFGQGMSNVQQINDALLRGRGFDNEALARARGFDFGTGLQANQFENEAGQTQFKNRLLTSQAELDNMIRAGGFNNTNRQQAIMEEAYRRNMPLNELNALLTGQQVNMPGMPNFNQSNRAGGVDYTGALTQGYGAGLDQFAADQARQQGYTSAAAALGSAAMYAWLSDRRLKKDIGYLFTLPNGIRVYKFRFVGGAHMQIGVMAQEVAEIMPEAVSEGADGYLRVNYNLVLA